MIYHGGAAQHKALFDRFYAMESFTLQSSYIGKSVTQKKAFFSLIADKLESRRFNTMVCLIRYVKNSSKKFLQYVMEEYAEF